jgi:hypothetical protein
MEAQDDICYAKDSQKETFPQTETFKHELLSEGEVTLNAKRGMVGSKEFPLIVKSKGILYLGAKSRAYVNGFCKDDFPSNYPKNPPPYIIFNKNEIPFVFNEELFKEEEELLSLAPDLFHGAPFGFVDAKHFILRRASIYYFERDAKISILDEEKAPGVELSQADE